MSEKVELGPLIAKIHAIGAKFNTDYGVESFDLCVGPEEFEALASAGDGKIDEEALKQPHPQMFYLGLRVHRMTSPGVLVGCLSAKTGHEAPKWISDDATAPVRARVAGGTKRKKTKG